MTEVKEVGPFERILTVPIGEDLIEEATGRAARRLAGQLKIKGFRPGKAPRRIVESVVGAEELRREAIDEALPEAVAAAIEGSDLRPATTPRLEGIEDTEDGVAAEVRITLWPTVAEPPPYRGRRIALDRPAVDDEAVDAQIDRMRDQFAELEDVSREAFDGDFVLVDVHTSADGEEVAAGSAGDLLYEVGSGSFLPGMDEPLRGSGAGHIAEFATTLPAFVGEEGGREAQVRVLVKQVKAKRLPELTDEWVGDVSEFETVDEMRDALREQMESVRLGSLRAEFEQRLLDELREELPVVLPEGLVEAEMESTLHRFVHRLRERGIELEQYLALTGQDRDGLVADLRSQAEANLETRILLESIAEAEGLEVSSEDVDEVIAELASEAGVAPEEYRAAVERSGQGETLAGDILRRKAIRRLLESAVAVDGDGNELSILGEAEAGPGDEPPDDQESDESGPETPAEEEE